MLLKHGETVTVERYTQDPHGGRTKVSEHTIANFAVLIRSSTEPLNLRNDVVTTATGVGPYGADLQATDRVIQADGTRWEVIGKPNDLKSPLTGWKAAQRSTLQHVSG